MPEASALYTHGHDDSVLRSHRWRTAANSAAYLLGSLRPGQTLLDVGCGPGTITADLAARVAPGRVVAVDAAPDVLDEARRALAARALNTVEVRLADVHALDFADGTFDVVHAHQVLQHVADPVRALREMRRVCRPGGIVAARDSDYAAMTWFPAVPELDEWLDLYRRVARANGGEPDAGRRLHAWARAAGFRDVTCSASAWCFAGAEDRAWWAGMWRDRIVDSGIARHAVAGGHATEGDLRRLSDAWARFAGTEDGWFTILHGEILCVA
jgi:SAM-dependent methyltransferase